MLERRPVNLVIKCLVNSEGFGGSKSHIAGVLVVKRCVPFTLLMWGSRSDLEKAIAAHGGPVAVAQQLGWRLAYKQRKPRGYWDSLPNVRRELDDFIEENGLDPGAAHIAWSRSACYCNTYASISSQHDTYPYTIAFLRAKHILWATQTIFRFILLLDRDDAAEE